MATTTAVSQAAPGRSILPRTLLLLGRLALGFVFLYAAYAKLHFDGALRVIFFSSRTFALE